MSFNLDKYGPYALKLNIGLDMLYTLVAVIVSRFQDSKLESGHSLMWNWSTSGYWGLALRLCYFVVFYLFLNYLFAQKDIQVLGIIAILIVVLHIGYTLTNFIKDMSIAVKSLDKNKTNEKKA